VARGAGVRRVRPARHLERAPSRRMSDAILMVRDAPPALLTMRFFIRGSRPLVR
jgi:hypothetical protein